jgi:hypothetical protein
MTFTFTSNGQCPECGHHEFTSPSNPTEYAPITCLGCDCVTTVKKAVDTFRAAEFVPKHFPERN